MPSLLSWRPPGPVAKLPISGSQEMLPWPLCKEQRMTQSYIEPNAAEQCVEKSNCYFWNSKRSWLRNLELNSLSLGLWLLFGIAEDHNKKDIGISWEIPGNSKTVWTQTATPKSTRWRGWNPSCVLHWSRGIRTAINTTNLGDFQIEDVSA